MTAGGAEGRFCGHFFDGVWRYGLNLLITAYPADFVHPCRRDSKHGCRPSSSARLYVPVTLVRCDNKRSAVAALANLRSRLSSKSGLSQNRSRFAVNASQRNGHPQPHRLHQAHSAAIQQGSDQRMGARQTRQHRLHLTHRQYYGQTIGRFGLRDVIQPWQLNFQDLAVKKQQGRLGLILS